MLLVSDVFVLINYYSQILWFSVAASIGGMLWLRYKRPDMPRPIKVNLIIPITFLICCKFLILFPIPDNPWNALIGIGITLSGIPFYYLFVKYKNKPEGYNKITRTITETLQKTLAVTYPEAEQKLSLD